MTSETDDDKFIAWTQKKVGIYLTDKDEDRLFDLARRGAEAGKLLDELDREYNRETNDMIARHAEKARAAADRIAQLEAEVKRQQASERSAWNAAFQRDERIEQLEAALQK